MRSEWIVGQTRLIRFTGHAARCRCFPALRAASRRRLNFWGEFERSGVGNSCKERRFWVWPILEEPPER
jgi:hypothetical protein